MKRRTHIQATGGRTACGRLWVRRRKTSLHILLSVVDAWGHVDCAACVRAKPKGWTGPSFAFKADAGTVV